MGIVRDLGKASVDYVKESVQKVVSDKRSVFNIALRELLLPELEADLVSLQVDLERVRKDAAKSRELLEEERRLRIFLVDEQKRITAEFAEQVELAVAREAVRICVAFRVGGPFDRDATFNEATLRLARAEALLTPLRKEGPK